MLEMTEDASLVKKRAGVIPGDCLDGRLVERFVGGNVWAIGIARSECAIIFDIDLLHSAEAAELALRPIEIAVVITVAGGKAGFAPAVGHRHPLHAVHGKGQLGDPGLTRLFILQIKLG